MMTNDLMTPDGSNGATTEEPGPGRPFSRPHSSPERQWSRGPVFLTKADFLRALDEFIEAANRRRRKRTC